MQALRQGQAPTATPCVNWGCEPFAYPKEPSGTFVRKSITAPKVIRGGW